jgi:hypothetical protein
MIVRRSAYLLLALWLAACAGSRGDPPAAGLAGHLGGFLAGSDGPSAAAPAVEAARRVSPAIWGVVPSPPPLRTSVTSDMIRGSAVAVASDTLLVGCRAVYGREWVGVVRLGMYRLARVESARSNQDVCVLRAPDAPLTPVPEFRRLGDLRRDELVYAVVNQTSSDLAVAEGRVAARERNAAYQVETNPPLPRTAQSVVLIDGRGTLIGLAAAGTSARPVILAGAVTTRLAPRLALRDRLEPVVRLARLEPQSEGPQSFFLVRLTDEPEGPNPNEPDLRIRPLTTEPATDPPGAAGSGTGRAAPSADPPPGVPNATVGSSTAGNSGASQSAGGGTRTATSAAKGASAAGGGNGSVASPSPEPASGNAGPAPQAGASAGGGGKGSGGSSGSGSGPGPAGGSAADADGGKDKGKGKDDAKGRGNDGDRVASNDRGGRGGGNEGDNGKGGGNAGDNGKGASGKGDSGKDGGDRGGGGGKGGGKGGGRD